MTLGDIVKNYRISHNLSMDDFARKSGISKSYISILEKNKHPKTGKKIIPSIQTIKQAAEGMNIDFNVLFSRLEGEVDISIPANSRQSAKGVRINVLGRVAAGVPIEAQQEITDWEEISEEMAATGQFFALQIHGDSMLPRIQDGDVVIVRQQPDIDSGDVAIIMVNGSDATCKRVAKYSDGIRLIPNNPSYEPVFYSNEEIESKPVKVIGKVVELRGKF